MSTIARRFGELFWAPVSAAPLAFLRIALGLILLAQAASVSGAFFWLFGDESLFDAGLNGYVSNAFDLARQGLGIFQRLGASHDQSLLLVAALYVASLISLVLGYRTRLSAVVAWLLHSLFLRGSPMTTYGVDIYASVFLFYFIFFPTARIWSLDARLGRTTRATTYVDTLCLRLAQCHFAVAYADAGFSKGVSAAWWNGEAIWRALMLPEFRSVDLSWFAALPWIPVLLGAGTVILELAYPIFIWSRRTRMLWLPAVVGMHLGICLFQGLHLFGLTMIALNVGLFGYPYWARQRLVMA